jgi:hypothetical protein
VDVPVVQLQPHQDKGGGNECVREHPGLWSGIEANLHTVRAIWPQSAGWLEELDDKDDALLCNKALWQRVRVDGMADPAVDPGATEDDHHSRYEWGLSFGSALFDARNGFNELNRYLMLWNDAHLWNRVSWFAFNWYRHWVCCLVRSEPGTQASTQRRGSHKVTALPLACMGWH